jgi:ribonuclease P protein component
MLGKAHRLNSQEVSAAIKEGRRSSTGLFSLYILKKGEKAKYAVIIPKKLAKTSVLRHKHKRRIMASIVKCAHKHLLPSVYIVFTLKKDINTVDFKDLYAHIYEILAKI